MAYVKEVKKKSMEEAEYATIEQGQHFGELEVIYEMIENKLRPREETIKAKKPCKLLAFDKQDLESVFDQFKEIFLKLY